VEEHLFNKKDTVILTSATLRTAGSFDFIRSRLNAHEARALTVGSPFDYEASTLLYLPTDMPEPNTPGYQQTVERTLISLCKATQGRTLVLFTSHNQLRRTAQAIAPLLADEDIVVYEQGDGSSRRQLLENFRTTPRSVLLGTRSFWEGIDVVGEALSCLVIVRLPFAVPTDPIFAARAESMEDPFGQYAVPDAILRFRQGFGRLIRSQTDRGVVVVLDRRIQSKAYGQLFLDSLPSCTVHRGPLANLPRLAAEWIDGRWPGADLRVRPSLV
jgi:DNA polymerase-3 subunit epsilon/ATP-dependent DNA helicase DinG